MTEWIEWYGCPTSRDTKTPHEGKTYLIQPLSGDIVKAVYNKRLNEYGEYTYFHHIPEPGKPAMEFSRSKMIMHWAELPEAPTS